VPSNHVQSLAIKRDHGQRILRPALARPARRVRSRGTSGFSAQLWSEALRLTEAGNLLVDLFFCWLTVQPLGQQP
jgi:hypothetical protein